MDFLQWAQGRQLPSALQSRKGWGDFFEYHRSREPHIHQIEPTNYCPYSCLMCPRNKHMKRANGFMELDLFCTIIDEIATYSSVVRQKEIELFHFGEALFHPQLADMVRYCSDAGLRPTLSINPGDLTEKLSTAIMASNPYKIIVSLDSLQPGRYKLIRGNHADLEKGLLQTNYLLACHRKMGGETELVIRMIVMNINADEVGKFTSYWEEKGATVEIREFFPWSKKEFKDIGTVNKYPPYMPCPFPWQYMVVQWNGDVVGCCRDYDGNLKFGNVKEKSLKDIWNGNEYTDFRNKMLAGGELSTFCEECLSLYYNDPAIS